MKVKFTKVYRDDIPGGLRTPSVIGECVDIPKEGECFIMAADPLHEGNMRYIQTSCITDIDIMDNMFTITTENNSVYTIEVLEDDV